MGAALDQAPEGEVTAVLSLGANLGDTEAALRGAVEKLDAAAHVSVSGQSPRAVTSPVGGPQGQPDFLNQVVTVTTTLAPRALLELCHQIEAAAHRIRDVRWGPRTLDLDIITYGQVTSEDEDLILPHPRAAERGFVLVPWLWLDPNAMLAGTPVAKLVEHLPEAQDVRNAQDLPGGARDAQRPQP